MTNEQIIMRKVSKLPRDEQFRVAEIFNAMSRIINGMISCRGPDDAHIATVCAISTVISANAFPDPIASRHMLAHTMLDFIIDALVERRKPHEHFQTRGK